MPNRNNMTKNSTAHMFGYGIIAIASGYVTNARPGPPVATCATGIPVRCDIKPSTENTTKPANMLVVQLITGIRMQSLDACGMQSSEENLYKEVLVYTILCCCENRCSLPC